MLAVAVAVANAACGRGETDDSPEEPASVARSPAFETRPIAGAVVVNDANLPEARWGEDSWELARDGDAPVVADDALTLAVSYSGGCARHDFTLVAESRFRGSDPARLVLSLAHDANGDRCEAYPTESVRFDLAPVRALWERASGRRDGVVRLLLRGAEGADELDLVYTFEASP